MLETQCVAYTAPRRPGMRSHTQGLRMEFSDFMFDPNTFGTNRDPNQVVELGNQPPLYAHWLRAPTPTSPSNAFCGYIELIWKMSRLTKDPPRVTVLSESKVYPPIAMPPHRLDSD